MKHQALPVLMYHHVSPHPGLVTVSPEVFAAQMRWLARAGYHSLSGDNLAHFLAGGAIPRKSVLITFDDVYLDNWVYAHPILAQYGLSALLFIVTGWLGEGEIRAHVGETTIPVPPTPSHRACMEAIEQGQADAVMLRWSEIHAMRQAGTFEFHSHTHTHTRWDKLTHEPALKRRWLLNDLLASRETLHHQLGRVSEHLCWPQGYHDSDYLSAAQEAGFRYLYTTQKGLLSATTDRYKIPRVVVKNKGGWWFRQRVWLYRQARLGRAYVRLRGQ